jgi:hypothetical protein
VRLEVFLGALRRFVSITGKQSPVQTLCRLEHRLTACGEERGCDAVDRAVAAAGDLMQAAEHLPAASAIPKGSTDLRRRPGPYALILIVAPPSS